MLLRLKVDLSVKNTQGVSAIALACQTGNAEIVELLLTKINFIQLVLLQEVQQHLPQKSFFQLTSRGSDIESIDVELKQTNFEDKDSVSFHFNKINTIIEKHAASSADSFASQFVKKFQEVNKLLVEFNLFYTPMQQSYTNTQTQTLSSSYANPYHMQTIGSQVTQGPHFHKQPVAGPALNLVYQHDARKTFQTRRTLTPQ